jgi:hypothetical protein
MTRVRRGVTAGLATVPAVLAGASWHALAALVVSGLIVVAAVCWAIAAPGRAERLATLIRAWRGTARPTQPGGSGGLSP